MNKLQSFLLVFGALAFPVLSRGQMSTFPSPPPLATDPQPPQAAPAHPALNPPSDSETSDASQASEAKGTGGTVPAATKPSTGSTVVAATLNSMSALDDKVSLEAGDTISYRVLEDEDEAVTRVVTETGDANFPYIGLVKVEGKTCRQVAVEVKKLLEVDYYKQATVIVGLDQIPAEDKEKAKDMVWIVGEVHEVGPLELSKVQPMSVSQAILRAGGFGDFADQRKVKVIHRRPGEAGNAPPDVSKIQDGQVVDVKAVFDGVAAADPILKPGDYIIVPKKLVNFY